ncbi:hypothetical protein BDF14DRAFT_1885276 [Spinellus fusiger]|nr:hypothetical protein BDF14DRAFT_1885276 [Spinellus fusiger]
MSDSYNNINIIVKTPEIYGKYTSLKTLSAILHEVLNMNNTQAKPSHMFNMPASTVRNIVKHYKKTNQVEPSPKSGRKRKLDDRAHRWLKRTVMSNSRQTKVAIRTSMAIKVSDKTLKRYLDILEKFYYYGLKYLLIINPEDRTGEISDFYHSAILGIYGNLPLVPVTFWSLHPS